MTSAFYAFHLEPAWYKFQAMAKPVSGPFASRWVPNLWAEEKACNPRWQSWPWGGSHYADSYNRFTGSFVSSPSPWKQRWTHPARFDAMVLFPNTISRAVRTYELRLMLQKHDSLCVAKERRIFSLSRIVQRSWRNQDVGVKTCLPGFTLSIGVKCGAENPVNQENIDGRLQEHGVSHRPHATFDSL